MRKINSLFVILALLISQTVMAQSARVQIIHNSPDAAAEKVDIWLNETLLLDDFQFRTASPFIDAPAKEDLIISIADPESTSPDNPIARYDFRFEPNQTYKIIANGIVSSTGYNPAPAFDLYVYESGREATGNNNLTESLFFHGATDAPAIDIFEKEYGQIIDGLAYGEFDGYISFPTNDYVISIYPDDQDVELISYIAPFDRLEAGGDAMTIIASGFLDRTQNSDGASFGLFLVTPEGGDFIALSEYEPMAKLQLIHNAADPVAETVDIYVNDVIFLNDFRFRTATAFVDVPAETNLSIDILPSNSTSSTNPLATFNQNFADGINYTLIANGLVTDGFTPFKGFDLYKYGNAKTMAAADFVTDLNVFHGGTDAPTIDIYEKNSGALIDDLSYSNFTGYLELPTQDYVLEIRDMSGENTLLSYVAPLSSLNLGGAAINIVASGFLNPAENNNGEAFGLFAVPASGGDFIALPEYEATALVQVIHNSADAAAASVDIWLNDMLLLDDFMFRQASPFVDAPAGEDINIHILPPNSTSNENPIATYTYNLMDGGTYMIVANGILSESGYDPAQPFDLYVYDMAREMASDEMNTDVLVFHGATDAPIVDVYEMSAGELVDNLDYSDFRGYLELPTADYILEVRDETGMETLLSYDAPLETLGLQGEAISVFASGFLNPDNNSNGDAFGLFVALADGGDLIPLPVYEPQATARVQVIHNSADAAAASVDIWLNDMLLLDDFMFRQASPFVDAPAGEDINIHILPPNSTSNENPIATYTYNLMDGGTYMIVANGILSESGYDPAQPFDLYVYDMAREMASDEMNTDVLVFHGATDAPIVDIYEMSAGELVDNLDYSDFRGYLELPTADYVLEVRDETGMETLLSYDAPLETLGLQGEAISVFASGFLNPDNNSNGDAFGLFVALADGGDLIPLPVYEPQATARVQVIHNSADAAAASVDIWLNDMLLLDDFMFRQASPFVDAPAGEDINIHILPPNSTSNENPIATYTYNLMDGGTYMIVANGILSESGYDPAQPFDLYVYDMAREMASDEMNTDVLVFHGATDAPIVDIYEMSAGELVDNLNYSDFRGYLELPTADYVLEVRDETGMETLLSYDAPLETLGLQGEAISVFASGFLNPDNNSNGEAFGLFVALASGGDLIPLPATTATSVAENELIGEISIFPNPATDVINIRAQGNALSQVQILSLTGELVYESTLNANEKLQIGTEFLSSGLYIVSLTQGSARQIEKITVTR